MVPLKINAGRGFTLLEIIIALAIVAIAVLAIAKAMNQHTHVAGELQKRIVASWVAGNVIAELRHKAKTDKVKIGSSSDIVKMGGHRWRARAAIKETDVEKVYLVTVEVKDENERNAKPFATLTSAINDPS